MHYLLNARVGCVLCKNMLAYLEKVLFSATVFFAGVALTALTDKPVYGAVAALCLVLSFFVYFLYIVLDGVIENLEFHKSFVENSSES